MSVQILNGDCLALMPTLAADSVDSIVTDPPYGLSFMGKDWDHGVPGVEFWKAALRVAKPGAYLLAFGGTRTYHRLACAIEDSGWEIRDQIGWAFGSGFPKSHNGPWGGTALKPAWEPICMARKPIEGTVAANVGRFGTGGLNIDLCRVEWASQDDKAAAAAAAAAAAHRAGQPPEGVVDFAGRDPATWDNYVKSSGPGRWPANLIHDGCDEVLAAFPQTESGRPCGVKAGNNNKIYGQFSGGIPVTGYGDAGIAARFFYCAKADRADRNEGLDGMPMRASGMVSNTSGQHITRRDGGAPPPAANHHPTVKPTDLMRYLCRLVTPKDGVVLDPFMGSGSTGKAAMREGFSFIGIELSAEYIEIARRRIHSDAPLFAEVA